MLIVVFCIRTLEKSLELLTDGSDRLEAEMLMSENMEAMYMKCKRENWLVGSVACVEEILQHTPDWLTQNYAAEFINSILDTLFRLIAALCQRKNNVDKKYVEDCVKFYGLRVSRVLCFFVTRPIHFFCLNTM